jgi:hypothetical protein
MIETIRKYWIGLLVLVMITIHASIVGLIRYQASLAKVDMSCEVDLGRYIAFSNREDLPIAMRLHAIVPLNHRMKSRQLIELNQAQIRQSLEEHIRQIDARVFSDPYLSDLRTQLFDIMVQTVGRSAIDDMTITEVERGASDQPVKFVSRSATPRPRQLVATLRGNEASEESEESEGHQEVHEDPSTHEESSSGSAESGHSAAANNDSHADATHKPADGAHGSSHGDSHAKPKRKPAVKYDSSMKKKKADSHEKKSGH